MTFGPSRPAGSETQTTERTLMRLECSRQGERITITAEADSFLYRMVRLMVSGLLAAGRGELPSEALQAALKSGERPSGAKGPAPACGLCLMQVSYGDGR